MRFAVLSLAVAIAFAQHDDPEWDAYKAKYKKHYTSDADEQARYQLYQTARFRVASLNKLNGKAGAAFGINWMSDRYPHEQHKTGHIKPKGWKPTAPVLELTEAPRNPPSINWRDTEAVT